MKQKIAHVCIIVRDYDEAINFYTKKLGFKLIQDLALGEKKRWVLLAPKESNEYCLLLARADNAEQKTRIGNQTGGRVFLFLYTDDFWTDYRIMMEKGIVFIREPIIESYGTVAVFSDLYGNMWDLIEPNS